MLLLVPLRIAIVSQLHSPLHLLLLLLHCALDVCAAETLLANLKTLNESIVTLHANYLSGNEKKMNRMREYGFWLAHYAAPGAPPGNQHLCHDYVPHELAQKAAAAAETDGV